MSSSRGFSIKKNGENLLLLSTSIDVLSTQLFCTAMIGKEDFDLEKCFALPAKVSQKIDEHSQHFIVQQSKLIVRDLGTLTLFCIKTAIFKRRELRNLCRSDEIFASLMLCRWRVLSTFSSERGVRRRFKSRFQETVGIGLGCVPES